MLSLDLRCNSRYEYGDRKPNGKNLSQVNFFSSFLTRFYGVVTSKKWSWAQAMRENWVNEPKLDPKWTKIIQKYNRIVKVGTKMEYLEALMGNSSFFAQVESRQRFIFCMVWENSWKLGPRNVLFGGDVSQKLCLVDASCNQCVQLFD